MGVQGTHNEGHGVSQYRRRNECVRCLRGWEEEQCGMDARVKKEETDRLKKIELINKQNKQIIGQKQ